MCLAIPAQIIEFVDTERFLARVEVSGVRRRELARRADFSITIRPLGHAFTNVTTDSADLALNASSSS